VDDLQEQLPSAGIKHKYSAVDRFGGEVALKRLVDGDAVDLRGGIASTASGSGRVAISAPRSSERPKRGHDVPLMDSNDWGEHQHARATRDPELKGA